MVVGALAVGEIELEDPNRRVSSLRVQRHDVTHARRVRAAVGDQACTSR